MIIKEIVLNNFRIYGGQNSINLTPDGDKNIIIVSGKNGYGKTTFLMSLVWCLYGKQMEMVDEMYKKEIKEKRSYNLYIANSLNVDSQNNGESRFSVKIVFTDVNDPELSASEITIERFYDKGNTSADDLIVLFDGRQKEEWRFLPKKERIEIEEHFIRENILPLEVAKFFFFDAEKIVAFAQSDSAELGKELSEAYSQVLGIQKYANLKAELQNIRSEYRKSSATGEERTTYDNLDQQIQNGNQTIKDLRGIISTLDQTMETIRIDREEKQKLIIQNGASISEDELMQLHEEEEKYGAEMQESQSSMKELYNLIPFGLAGGLLAELIEQIQKEARFKQRSQTFDAVDEKANAILSDLDNKRLQANFPIEYQVRSFYETTIFELIKKHFCTNEDGENFDNFVPLHNISEVRMKSLMETVGQVKELKERFLRINHKYNSDKINLESIAQKVRDAEAAGESPLLTRLRAELTRLDGEYDKAIIERTNASGEIDRIKEDIKSYKQQRETLGKKITVSDDVKKYDEELGRLISILDTFITQYQRRKVDSLKHRISAKLKSFMHKTDLIESVDIFTIDGNIEIILKDKEGRPIDQSTLSMGEKQLFSSAILGSLVEETSYKFPVFIDSPLQKLDLAHSNNILKEFYPTVSDQVVMFPLLHKELTPQEYELIREKVSKVFLIENHDKKSKFVELSDKDDLFNNPLGK